MKINRAFQSTRTIKCKFTFWLLCLVSAFSAPRTAFGLNQTIAGKNYYHNAAWVPTYISKQYGGMVCISEVQVSLDENGKAQLKASLLLTSQPVIDANFKVQVVGKNTDMVTCQDVGYKLKALVTENATGNSCWSFVLIEDKLKPSVKCKDTTVLCTGTIADLDSISGILTLNDNCTPNSLLKISHFDKINMMDCANDTFSMVFRNWSAIDPWGRIGTCSQKISLLRPKLSDIFFPKDTTIYCPNSNFTPSATGQPLVKGKPLDKFCGWSSIYEDFVFSKCGNSKKILRTWNILNCCSVKDTSVTQFILFLDTTKPTITCKVLDSVSTSPDRCEAEYLLKPVLSATDACTTTGMTTIIQIDHLYYGLPNTKTILSTGLHWLSYEVSDACGNKSTCNSTLIVKDKQKPFLLCPDTIQVSIPALNVRLGVKDISSILLFDNCGIYNYTFRRTIDNCLDGIDDTKFKETLAVCCSDVFKSFDFVFLASDLSGNLDSCHVKVNVVDKSAPQLNCHLDSTINCNQSKPILLDPRLTLLDNCVDSVKIKIDTLINAFNICGIGQFKRRITAIDPGNNKDTCFQTITVLNVDTLKPADIIVMDTVKVIGCADSLRDPGHIGYQPPIINFYPIGCHKIFVSFMDSFQITTGTSRCRIVKRTWRVGDTCLSLSPIKVLNQIIIQDTTAFSPIAGPILGNVISITGIPIENVHVEGRNELHSAIYSQMTAKDGAFNYNNSQHIVTLSLLKDENNSLNGISTLDLLKIQRHISGTKLLTDPRDLFAADVNGDGDINVIDLLELRKYLLGLVEIENNLPWKFIRDNSSTVNIHLGMSISNEFDLNPNSNILEKFIGFRIGDVNHDATYNGLNQLEIRENQTRFSVANSLDGISIFSFQPLEMNGMQMSFSSSSGWDGVNIESSIKGMQYSINNSELRINWTGANFSQLSTHLGIVTLKRFHLNKRLQEGQLKAEWYDKNDQVHPIQFIYAETHPASVSDLKVYPNPGKDFLNVELQGQTALASWSVMDETGRILLKGKGDSNSILLRLNISTLPSGLYILQTQQSNGKLNKQRFVKTL